MWPVDLFVLWICQICQICQTKKSSENFRETSTTSENVLTVPCIHLGAAQSKTSVRFRYVYQISPPPRSPWDNKYGQRLRGKFSWWWLVCSMAMVKGLTITSLKLVNTNLIKNFLHLLCLNFLIIVKVKLTIFFSFCILKISLLLIMFESKNVIYYLDE